MEGSNDGQSTDPGEQDKSEDPHSSVHSSEDDEEEEDEDDDEEEEEGMKAAYSVSDLLGELESDENNESSKEETEPPTDEPAEPDLDTPVLVNGETASKDNHTQDSNSSESTVENELDAVLPPDICDEDLRCRTLRHDYINDPTAQQKINTYEPIPGETLQTTYARDLGGDGIYENVDNLRGGVVYEDQSSEDDEDGDEEWDSSEFDHLSGSYASSPEGHPPGARRGPPTLPQRNKKKKKRSNIPADVQVQQLPAKMRHQFARLKSRNKKDEDDESEEDTPVLDFTLDQEKHPPPRLQQQPTYLTPLQEKRRLIVSSIVDTENSYVASLRRIVNDYEKPLLAIDPKILSKTDIRVIFYKVRDILQCHTMFQIELAATVKVWDEEEKIGSVFNGSFSKSMVFEVYSAFVNNFSVAMEMAKKQMSSKQSFADFLKEKMLSYPDRLSLFGLMVKPVQRFPQFILILQDLLSHTSADHHDRRPLQMALTELENLTHKLNETKRESESRHDAHRILGQIGSKLAGSTTGGSKGDPEEAQRYLIRQENMVMTHNLKGESKTKRRRLILLNDQLLCVSTHAKSADSGSLEKYRLKWCIPVQDVTIVHSAFNTTTGGKLKPCKFQTPVPPPPDHPHKKALDDLLHDLPVIEQVKQMVSSLRFKYQNLTPESLQGLTRHLQLLIHQKMDIDQCTIRLSLPTKHLLTPTDKIKDEVTRQISSHIKHPRMPALDKPRQSHAVYTFQVQSPSQKQDWLLEIKNAKLALNPANKPGWCLPEDLSHFTYKLPLFMKTLPIDITRQETKGYFWKSSGAVKKVQCATPIMLPSHDQPGVGIQHLWVCSGDKAKGHVTIVSITGDEPHAIESFRSAGGAVCAEGVPGVESEDLSGAGVTVAPGFEDTVWVATEEHKIHIYNVMEETRKGPKLTFDTAAMVTFIRYHDNHVYVGHQTGSLVIYSRAPDVGWSASLTATFPLGPQPVSCLLPVSPRAVWAACGAQIHVISRPEGTHRHTQSVHDLRLSEPGSIECMVRAGVGLIVSFRNKDVIRLYHLKTLDFLQDINMASVVRKFFDGQPQTPDLREGLKHLSVTCLQVTKGLLWIGTNVGCVLSLPLPRLEGVPRISGRPCVSYHAHTGYVRFLTALNYGALPLNRAEIGSLENSVEVEEPAVVANGIASSPTNRNIVARSADFTLRDRFVPADALCVDTLKSISTPNLTEGYGEDRLENLHSLYGSLMRGLNTDSLDYELEEQNRSSKRSSKVNKISKEMVRQTGKQVTKMSGVMMTKIKKQWNGPKAATLPVLHEDGNSQSSTDGEIRNSQGSSGDYCSMGASDSDSTGLGTSNEGFYENTQFPEHNYENVQECRESYIRAMSTVIPDSQSQSSSSNNKPKEKPIYPGVHLTSHIHSKSVVVISGGDGHTNWQDTKSQVSKYEDICLLMWQLRE